MSHRQRKYELQNSDETFDRHIREHEFLELKSLGLIETVVKDSGWVIARMKPQSTGNRSPSAPTHHDTYRAVGLPSRPHSTRGVHGSQQDAARKKIKAWSGSPEHFVYRKYPHKEHDEQALQAIRDAHRRLVAGELPLLPMSTADAWRWLNGVTCRFAEIIINTNVKREDIPLAQAWFNDSRYVQGFISHEEAA